MSKQSHKEKILEILADGMPHSNFEIHEKTKILRYSARILDLKKDGHNIRGWDDAEDRQKYWYQLQKKLPIYTQQELNRREEESKKLTLFRV